MPTTLADLLKPALRKAGITKLPGTTPSSDQYNELIPEMNRMISLWNLDGYRILSQRIDSFPYVTDQVSYTIGTGGDFNMPRPVAINAANNIFPTTPDFRQGIKILTTAQEWAAIQVQQVPGAPAWYLYYDHDYNSSGLGKIYVYPQPPDGYELELYSWKQIQGGFTATTDVIVMGPGYEDAIVNNFALRVASLYPLETQIQPVTEAAARSSLSLLKQSNARAPLLVNETAFFGNASSQSGLAPFGAWLAGPFQRS